MTPPRGSSMTTWHYRCGPELLTTWSAISQSRSGSVGSRLIRQVLAVCDGAGRFCRGEKTSGSASAEPFGEEKERNAMHPDKKSRRVSIVAGNQLESGCAVTTN